MPPIIEKRPYIHHFLQSFPPIFRFAHPIFLTSLRQCTEERCNMITRGDHHQRRVRLIKTPLYKTWFPILWSYFLRLHSSLAAVLRTDCRQSRRHLDLGVPTSKLLQRWTVDVTKAATETYTVPQYSTYLATVQFTWHTLYLLFAYLKHLYYSKHHCLREWKQAFASKKLKNSPRPPTTLIAFLRLGSTRFQQSVIGHAMIFVPLPGWIPEQHVVSNRPWQLLIWHSA